MLAQLQKLIERQILKAQLEGKLSGLDGEGKPLPERLEDTMVDAADAAGFRIMAQAGVVPEEIEIKKLMAQQRARIAEISDPNARKAAMSELAQLELRYNIAREARQKFLR